MKSTINSAIIKNGESIELGTIPVLDYTFFYAHVTTLLKEDECHCVAYYAFPFNGGLKFICCIADDNTNLIHVLSHELAESDNRELESITQIVNAMHIFEREIWENYGVRFLDHPWLKPVRYSFDRFDQESKVIDYPFYKIGGNQLHEVGVGPIHAGVIEPGHFRFLCNGENVLHLEIQLGWQHRGVEKLFLERQKLLQRNILAENIAGDTTIGHSLAFAGVMESLAGIEIPEELRNSRTIALELERIAMHTADIGALCVDTAYQLGANVFGALRTPLINYFQSWCGNRFGKGLIRVGGSHYEFSIGLKKKFREMMADFSRRFHSIAEKTYYLPSQQNRFDGIGTISEKKAKLIGAVGMVARMAGVKRDIRWSHPFMGYHIHPYEPVIAGKGDVFARFLIRRLEIEKSIPYMLDLINSEYYGEGVKKPLRGEELSLKPSSFCIAMTEGWRGEISHCAVTDETGNLAHYKIKDPSMHNWKALELSLRNLEISDFPINNKSYDLSYCGHDL